MAVRKLRILLGKFGEGHNEALLNLAKRLGDAGFEVIYTGLFQTPETIVAAAIQEDVDYIFLSSHLSGHMALSEQIVALLKEKQADGIDLVVGGLVPKRDFAPLQAVGVKKAFMPLTLASTVVDWVKSDVEARA